MTMIFDFQHGGQFRLTSNCEFPVGSLQATARSRYELQGNRLTIPYADHQEERTSNMTCAASIQQGSMNYGFEGSCLVLIDPNGEKLYLTPSN